jgi:uncharacterized membrane protein
MFGLIVLALSVVRGSYRIQICTVAGYAIGFIFAMLFNTDSFDPSGGPINNAWIIWAAVFLAVLFVGIALEIRHRRNTVKRAREVKHMQAQDLE